MNIGKILTLCFPYMWLLMRYTICLEKESTKHTRGTYTQMKCSRIENLIFFEIG